MRKRILLITFALILALIVVPIFFTQINRQQPTPRPPIELDNMSYEEVRFENPTSGIELAGMLFVPEG